MPAQAIRCTLADIQPLRELFLHEANVQFIHDKCHLYGWADTYRLLMGNELAGYGSVWGVDNRAERDCIFEFYLLAPYRKYTSVLFRELLSASGAIYIEAQTNDLLLSSMLFEFAGQIQAESILFHDAFSSRLVQPGMQLLAKSDPNPYNRVFELEQDGVVVASGGFLLNYNHPYADIYMEVKDAYRQKGFGSFIVQELKKEIYRAGKIPSARCNISNNISRSTLQKAGFAICGHWLKGRVKDNFNTLPTSI